MSCGKPHSQLHKAYMEELRSTCTHSSSCLSASKSSLLVCFSAPGVLRTLLCSAILIVLLLSSSCNNKKHRHKNSLFNLHQSPYIYTTINGFAILKLLLFKWFCNPQGKSLNGFASLKVLLFLIFYLLVF